MSKIKFLCFNIYTYMKQINLNLKILIFYYCKRRVADNLFPPTNYHTRTEQVRRCCL
uniref:Uncharacterized protein n=1 Tax=Oryza brachyantha TaxID=4533 RepID=J3MHC5_ORYBR